MKKRFLSLLLVGVMVFLAACGQKAAPTEKGTGGKDKDQHFNGYIQSDPATLDAQKGSDIYSMYVINNTLEPLLRLKEEADHTTKLEPAGAEKYEISEDKTVYKFTIRKGNKWDDGKEVTAKDYAYGIQRACDPKTASEMAFLLTPIKNAQAVMAGKMPLDQLGVKAVDDQTLEITLDKPTGYFLRLVPFRVMMPQRQDIVEKFGAQFGSESANFIGCGPFKLESWVHNSAISMVKNENYWDKDKVSFTKANYKIIQDVSTIMQSFDVGEIDAASTSLKEWTDRFNKKDNVNHNEIILPSVNYLTFNTKDKLMSNLKVRQAFSLAVNRDDMAKVVFTGQVNGAYGWVPPGISLDGKQYTNEEKAPLKEIIKANPDPKALLVEGLKELNMDPDPSKLDIKFSMGGTSPFMKTIGEYIQGAFTKNLGVKCDLQLNEWPVFSGNVNKGNYQLGYLAWTADYDDPSAMLSMFLKNANVVNTGWSNDEYDKYVLAGMQATDPAGQRENYEKAEKILIENFAVSPLINGKLQSYHYKYIKNFTINQFTSTGLKYMYTEGR